MCQRVVGCVGVKYLSNICRVSKGCSVCRCRALQCVGAYTVCASKACRVCVTKACSVCGSVRFVGCQKLVVCGGLDVYVCMHT